MYIRQRPGHGNSSEASTVRTGATIVEELRSLLRSKGLRPPYVLVGHSLGGLYMQLDARSHPDEVSALILVDSTHPNQFKGGGARENWPSLARVLLWVVSTNTSEAELGHVNETAEVIIL